MFGLCKDCKYWVDKIKHGPGYGQESIPRFNLKLCDSPKKFRDLRVGFWETHRDLPDDNDLVVLEDDIGWGIMTRAEFGCNHFADKPVQS